MKPIKPLPPVKYYHAIAELMESDRLRAAYVAVCMERDMISRLCEELELREEERFVRLEKMIERDATPAPWWKRLFK